MERIVTLTQIGMRRDCQGNNEDRARKRREKYHRSVDLEVRRVTPKEKLVVKIESVRPSTSVSLRDRLTKGKSQRLIILCREFILL